MAKVEKEKGKEEKGSGRRVDKRYHADTAQPVGRRPGDYQA